MTERIRLVVLYGGRSAEHEVSRTSGRYVAECARAGGLVVDLVGITRDGRWVRPPARLPDRGATGEALPTLGDDLPTVSADEALERRSGESLVVFPVLHGPFGEDGTVQGLCEMAGVPYVGPGVLSSAVCMDKPVSKRLLQAAGLSVARHIALRAGEVTAETPGALLAELGSPVFVKPANLGSSIGISKAADVTQVAEALALASGYDDRLIVEEFVPGRELEVSVLGNEELRASLPGEIVPGGEFYDYDDKYLNDTAELHAPADLPDEVSEEVQNLAVAAARALGVEGLGRVDFLYDEAASPNRRLIVSEINTMPGFTPISMYPRLWAVSGLDGPALIAELVRLALDRDRRRATFAGRGRMTLEDVLSREQHAEYTRSLCDDPDLTTS
ncbi:MAG: D-alanine--D-alanine ligase [bacterium]|nr:D-alanine--D-alanine ligase [bacterium]